MIVNARKYGKIYLGEKIGGRKEGTVYKITAPSHLTGYCVKIYKNPTQQRANKISFMVDNPPAQIEIQGKIKLGWPVDTIMGNGSFVGFMMPLAFSGSKELTSLIPNIRSTNVDVNWQKYNLKNEKRAFEARLKLIHNISVAINLLHQTNKYVLCDFKPDNVLVTHSGEITVCDIDSIQIAEGSKMLYHATANTCGYIPPEYYNRGMGKSDTDVLKKSWDSFALAVVYYKLLLGLHPYSGTPKIPKDEGESPLWQNIADDLFPNGKNRNKIAVIPPAHEKFKVLPQSIQDLFLRSFSLDADNRPSIDEWGNAIFEIIKSPKPNPEPVPSPPPPPRITTISNNTTWGTVSRSGNVITASPNSRVGYATPAYEVIPSGTATVIRSGNTFTVTASADCTICINFEKIKKWYQKWQYRLLAVAVLCLIIYFAFLAIKPFFSTDNTSKIGTTENTLSFDPQLFVGERTVKIVGQEGYYKSGCIEEISQNKYRLTITNPYSATEHYLFEYDGSAKPSSDDLMDIAIDKHTGTITYKKDNQLWECIK